MWQIRTATSEDWSVIGALLRAADLPLDGAREHLADFIVAADQGNIGGCIGLERYDRVGLLRSLAVADSHRGSGLGRRLVQKLIDRGRASGLETLVLLTLSAPEYFPRFGFRVIARAAAPAEVQVSEEFRTACPASATVMQLDLHGEAPA